MALSNPKGAFSVLVCGMILGDRIPSLLNPKLGGRRLLQEIAGPEIW